MIPYAYGTIIRTIYAYGCTIWAHMLRILAWYVPYAYGIKYAYGTEHNYLRRFICKIACQLTSQLTFNRELNSCIFKTLHNNAIHRIPCNEVIRPQNNSKTIAIRTAISVTLEYWTPCMHLSLRSLMFGSLIIVLFEPPELKFQTASWWNVRKCYFLKQFHWQELVLATVTVL